MNSNHIRLSAVTLICAVALLLPVVAARAQTPIPRYGEEDKPKTPAEIELERKSETAYKRSLNNVPEGRAVDPWGGVRSEPPAKAAPAKKKSGSGN